MRSRRRAGAVSAAGDIHCHLICVLIVFVAVLARGIGALGFFPFGRSGDDDLLLGDASGLTAAASGEKCGGGERCQ